MLLDHLESVAVVVVAQRHSTESLRLVDKPTIGTDNREPPFAARGRPGQLGPFEAAVLAAAERVVAAAGPLPPPAAVVAAAVALLLPLVVA